ncbi:DUF4190 domain-containing protein [Microbacterium sp. che218]|uniref:DUF4190 domain-containing protein n=1 Tax=Microbacterium sp. che218 TaxID=3140649 RepID=UPI003368F74B
MDKSLRLSMSATVGEAKAAVTALLLDQGFDIRERSDGLEADRTPAPRAKATKRPATRFRVRFSSAPDGAIVDVEPITGAPAVRTTVAMMRERLVKKGLLSAEPGAEAPAVERDGIDADAADDEVRRRADGDETADFWPFDQLTSPVDAPAVRAATPPLNALAVVSLVLGALAPVGGIVTGAIALGHIRRTGERGRGLALGGVVLGSVLTTVLSVSIVAAVGLLLVPSGAGTPNAAGERAAAASASPTATVEEGASSSFAPEVGQCFVKRGAGEIGEANLVDCGVPHAYELYEQFSLSGDEYPGDDLVARDSVGGCRDRFADFVGTDYDESRLELVYLSPTVKEWGRGDRVVSCLLADPDASVTGSLRESQR